MNIFFDVDHTLLAEDGSLRPGAREVFRQLSEDGHDLYVWSGMGVRWAEVREHGLDPFVRAVFLKPLHNFHAMIEQLGIPVRPDLVVDDYPELVEAFGGVLVRPYLVGDESDREMDRVYRCIASYSRDGA